MNGKADQTLSGGTYVKVSMLRNKRYLGGARNKKFRMLAFDSQDTFQ